MAFTPITGAISFADINTALGRSSTTSFSLGDTLVRQLTNQLSGAIDMNNSHASNYIGSTTTNVNLLTSFGSPATVTSYKALIPLGVTVGATTGNTALTVGQFATGSTITINNYGAIQAYGGAASSTGGDAINANYPNQTVTINNQTGAIIYGGGGGGGTGGSGGTGGVGGGGYYTTSGINYQYITSYPGYWVHTYLCCFGGCTYRLGTDWIWNGDVQNFNYGGVAQGYTATGGDGNTYIVGTLQYNCNNQCFGWQIGQYYNYNVYTSGGSGGSGGAGGLGGVGQGYGQANTTGASGSVGGAGAAGGTNAGSGGSGGTGGTGGAGGTWGVAGSAGSTGATGNTGAAGNNGSGASGTTGTAGSGGGTAGRYLVKGANSVTINNSGTVLGGLA
jgi:hypothetical protein